MKRISSQSTFLAKNREMYAKIDDIEQRMETEIEQS